MDKLPLEWKPVGKRLTRVRLKERHGNTTLVQCCSLSDDGVDDYKETI